MNNHPAISDAKCMLNFPEARAKERDCLLSKVNILSEFSVLDIQSAAGYLSDKVYKNLDGKVSCYCLEPSDVHRQRLQPFHIAINNPIEYFPSIATNTIDVAIGLAGLHHSNCHQSTINEMARTLKPGGQFAICDVIVGSNIALWLNEYVDKHSVAGHKGNFVQQYILKTQCETAGLIDVNEQVEQVPWHFPSENDLISFFKGLFGLTSSLEEVKEAIHHYFEIIVEPDLVTVPWHLLYVSGIKPKL